MCIWRCGQSSVCGVHVATCKSTTRSQAMCRQVYHEMVVLERIHSEPQFCPGAVLEALTSAPLRLH